MGLLLSSTSGKSTWILQKNEADFLQPYRADTKNVVERNLGMTVPHLITRGLLLTWPMPPMGAGLCALQDISTRSCASVPRHAGLVHSGRSLSELKTSRSTCALSAADGSWEHLQVSLLSPCSLLKLSQAPVQLCSRSSISTDRPSRLLPLLSSQYTACPGHQPLLRD